MPEIQQHSARELGGLFRDRIGRSSPVVIAGPGPSLHKHLLSWLTQRTILIAIGSVVKICTPTLWLHFPNDGVEDDFFPVPAITITTEKEALRLLQYNADIHPFLFTLDGIINLAESKLLQAVRITYLCGLRYIHFDGVDTEPSPNGSIWFQQPPSALTAWQWLDLCRDSLRSLNSGIFRSFRFYSYTMSFHSKRVRRIDPERYWMKKNIPQ